MDQATLQRIRSLPTAEKAELLQLIRQIDAAKGIEAARSAFIPYVKHIWPIFIEGRHHDIMGEAFDRVIAGTCKRLIINMGPRHTKSEFASWLLPSKYLGHYPERKVMQLSHTAILAEGFGRKVRDLVAMEQYREIFPDTVLKADTQAAARWSTSQMGEYFALGVGGKLSGRGADLLIIDDPHSEQDYIAALGGDSSTFDKVFEWYQTGPRQRLQPGAAIVIVMTRWHQRDLTGRLVRRMVGNPLMDQWEIIEFPALLPETDNPLWPEFWSYEELAATRAELSSQQWAAQYLQRPSSEGAALVKRDWWQIWEEEKPPKCEFVIQSWDTAFTAKETADYSACTTWGVFYLPDEKGLQQPNLILLDAYRERLDFPDLKKKAYQLWKTRKPDAFIVEAKASGMPLIFELRRMGIPVSEFTPTRGNDKVVRVNAVSDLFKSGVVWRPETRWAEEVAEEFAAFPVGEHDDYVDSSTQALLRFRQGGFIPLDSDEEDEKFRRRKKADYY